jgi:hypothetical protein
MPVTECYRRGSGSAMRRVFVDITTSLMLAGGEQPISISCVEGEIARRLLLFSNLNFIPVVFRNDGLLFALSPEQAALIFSSKPVADSQKNNRVSSAPAAKDSAATAEEQTARLHPQSLSTRLELLVTSRLRRAALAVILRMPYAVREDIRAIVIHAWRIVRTIVYRHPGAVASSPTVAASSIAAHSILPTLRTAVHPRSGDVLWTAGLYSDFVPLRTIGEMRARRGLRVVTTCYDLFCATHPEFDQPSVGAELFMADAVALLDASDLVLAVSERTRRELLAFATRIGRATPAVQVLQIGGELDQLLDPDDVAPAAARSKPEAALPDPPLWDEVAAVVEERLQMLLAETDTS